MTLGSAKQRPKAILMFLAVSLLAVTTLVVWRSVQNYDGYCRTENRYLSEKEKVDVAIDYVLQAYPPVIEMPVGSRNFQTPRNATSYANADDFRARNANCCALVATLRKSGYAPPFSVRIAGGFSTFVRLNYVVRYVSEDGRQIERPVESNVAVSNCGRTSSGI